MVDQCLRLHRFLDALRIAHQDVQYVQAIAHHIAWNNKKIVFRQHPRGFRHGVVNYSKQVVHFHFPLIAMPNMAVERDAKNATHFRRPSPLRWASQNPCSIPRLKR
jgi:hypothetical protein